MKPKVKSRENVGLQRLIILSVTEAERRRCKVIILINVWTLKQIIMLHLTEFHKYLMIVGGNRLVI